MNVLSRWRWFKRWRGWSASGRLAGRAWRLVLLLLWWSTWAPSGASYWLARRGGLETIPNKRKEPQKRKQPREQRVCVCVQAGGRGSGTGPRMSEARGKCGGRGTASKVCLPKDLAFHQHVPGWSLVRCDVASVNAALLWWRWHCWASVKKVGNRLESTETFRQLRRISFMWPGRVFFCLSRREPLPPILMLFWIFSPVEFSNTGVLPSHNFCKKKEWLSACDASLFVHLCYSYFAKIQSWQLLYLLFKLLCCFSVLGLFVFTRWSVHTVRKILKLQLKTFFPTTRLFIFFY